MTAIEDLLTPAEVDRLRAQLGGTPGLPPEEVDETEEVA